MPRESKFQSGVISDIYERLPGCEVLKLDTSYRQGHPDLLILHGPKWGVLECKKGENEDYQPNQEYYLEKFGRMSYASMICPENKKAVLDELQHALSPRRSARIPKSV